MHHFCETPRCTNKVQDKYANRGVKLCHKCVTREYKKKHPIRYAFSVLKKNAKRRKISFNLTYDEYKGFALKNRMFDSKGNKCPLRTVDRINPEDPRGYHIDNIQVLTCSENSRKRFVDYWRKLYDQLEEEAKHRFVKREEELYSDIFTRRVAESCYQVLPDSAIPF